LWLAETQQTHRPVPTPGAILQALTDSQIDGAAYDRELPVRQSLSLY
jgi:hypothetical protein